MRATEIAAYTFATEIYCPSCIVKALPTGEGEAYDGWGLAAGVTMSPEDNLNEIAHAFGIDRGDEHSFDSGDFPKVVFADGLDPNAVNVCGGCFRMLD